MAKESKILIIDKMIWQMLLAAFLVSGFLHVLLYGVNYTDEIVRIFDGAVIICWMVTILRKILDQRVRKYMVIIAALMVFFFMVQICKYKLFEQVWAIRYAWYCFYIPMILIPLFLFYLAIFMNQEDGVSRKGCFFLLIPAALLIAGVLTNDLHFQAFYFPDGLVDQSGFTGSYSYGFLYFLVIIWEALLVTVSLFIILKKCGTSVARKLFFIPAGTLMVGGILMLFGVFGLSPKVQGITIWQLPESYIYTMVLFLESCIQIGLIPANTGYEKRFMQLQMPVAIYDMDGKEVIRSAKTLSTNTSDEDTKIEEMELSGSRVAWGVDLKEIHSLNRQITEVTRQIESRNERLVSENQMKEEQAALHARNMLYNQIAELVKPQLDQIERLLNEGIEEDFDGTIAKVNVLNAYIKRRSNMELLKADTGRLPVSELIMAVRESVEYLKDTGIDGSVSAAAKDELTEKLVIFAYEQFERVVESCLGRARMIAVFLTCKDHVLRIRLLIEQVVSEPLVSDTEDSWANLPLVSDTFDYPEDGFSGYVQEERHKQERIITIMLEEGGAS